MTRRLTASFALAWALLDARALAQPTVTEVVIEPAPAVAPEIRIAPAPEFDPLRWHRRRPHPIRRWERPIRDIRRNAILYYPISALGRGFMLGYERAMPNPRFTLLGRSSMSFRAGGDFRSIDLEGSFEARYYPYAFGPFTRWRTRAPVGFYVGLRLGIVHSRLVDRRDGRLVGTLNRAVTEISVGYRFTIAGRLELTPWFGALFHADFVENLPAVPRPGVSIGTTMGVLF